ncbi:hypothetical protein LCL97_23305 [Seohaeicola saemankumensis]|nr:hypothetical protein [Seohaeicola saemankumensis]MCA0873770.1 hypothetical protein [Seohaeicola saemankumensis]
MRFRRPASALALALCANGALAADVAPLKQVQTARALFDIGLATGDPLYLLTAARLRKSVDLSPIERAPEGGVAEPGTVLVWQDMLAAARLQISGDPVLSGLADDIAAERSKGVSSGPVYSIVTIRPGGTDTYPQLPFSGGDYAEIYVEGASGTDLNVMVRDDKGRLVCSDTDISAIAYCGWRPATDGRFTIVVENQGRRGGQYSLMTN